MPLGIPLLLIAAMTATAIAGLAVYAPGDLVQTWVRRLSLTLLNLSPWTVGTWRREFSKRETFFAAWFLAFVLALIVLPFLPTHFEASE
jgi:hypothetical protein